VRERPAGQAADVAFSALCGADAWGRVYYTVLVGRTVDEDTTVAGAQSNTSPGNATHLELHWLFPPEQRQVTELDRANLTIGRGKDCELRLELASISRDHAAVYRDGPVFAVRDLGSRNGTFLNGEKLSHGALAPGDLLRLGDCVGLVTLRQPEAQASAFTQLAPDFFGAAELAAAVEPARRAAKSALPVVVVGETGTGKERVARAIHHWSGRSGPFHALNCAALPAALAEAELFGHAKGAFTGAERATDGRFRAAHLGTLLLDEAADLPASIQPKLLRLLEENEVVPLGGHRSVPIDVRIIVATQTPLGELVARGSFRQDLRARLSGVSVTLPPLRNRKSEIIPLFERFLKVHSGGRPPALEAGLVESLCLHHWPDNVRELDLLARSLLTFHGSDATLKRRFLPESIRPLARDQPSESSAWYPRRGPHDLRRLIAALKKSGGNVTTAAASLGFSRQRAYRLMLGRTVAELMAESNNEAS
jgi:DNA-binding NtrC family response regulator